MSKKRRISWKEAEKLEKERRKARFSEKEAKRSQKRAVINSEIYIVEDAESQMKAEYFLATRKDR